MSRLDDSVRLRHMLDAAREVASFTQGQSRTDLDADRMLQTPRFFFIFTRNGPEHGGSSWPFNGTGISIGSIFLR